MDIQKVFLNMLQYPNSPKTYRELRDLYNKLGRSHEAKAFDYLIEVKFNGSRDNNDNNNKK